jgi:hypothetical protein
LTQIDAVAANVNFARPFDERPDVAVVFAAKRAVSVFLIFASIGVEVVAFFGHYAAFPCALFGGSRGCGSADGLVAKRNAALPSRASARNDFFGRRRNERTRFEREATLSFVDFIRRRRRKKRNRAFFFAKNIQSFSREKANFRFVGANRSAAQIRSAAQKEESARRRGFLAKNANGSNFRFVGNKRRDAFFP